MKQAGYRASRLHSISIYNVLLDRRFDYQIEFRLYIEIRQHTLYILISILRSIKPKLRVFSIIIVELPFKQHHTVISEEIRISKQQPASVLLAALPLTPYWRQLNVSSVFNVSDAIACFQLIDLSGNGYLCGHKKGRHSWEGN